jgi:hypothetical protein
VQFSQEGFSAAALRNFPAGQEARHAVPVDVSTKQKKPVVVVHNLPPHRQGSLLNILPRV